MAQIFGSLLLATLAHIPQVPHTFLQKCDDVSEGMDVFRAVAKWWEIFLSFYSRDSRGWCHLVFRSEAGVFHFTCVLGLWTPITQGIASIQFHSLQVSEEWDCIFLFTCCPPKILPHLVRESILKWVTRFIEAGFTPNFIARVTKGVTEFDSSDLDTAGVRPPVAGPPVVRCTSASIFAASCNFAESLSRQYVAIFL